MLNIGCEFEVEGRLYTVLELLGKGANAAAYLAQCQNGGLAAKCILKEYSPADLAEGDPAFAEGKARFVAAGRAQNRIRQISALGNQTPPVNRIFEANGTAYVEVACYNGTALDKLIAAGALTLPQYIAICRTIAKTVGGYHAAGMLFLDLKPENIFILQNSPDDTVTQLVEFIDFDSVRELSQLGAGAAYTRDWAAPEQLNMQTAGRLGFAADIYTLGEIVFYILFGRHSAAAEHRGFSKYPFDKCRRSCLKYTERPDIQSLFTRFFRGTLRSSAANRFENIGMAADLLGEIIEELERKEYVIPSLPPVSPDFVGRDAELSQIAKSLSANPVLYITGVGGIGKSALVKNYITRYRARYEVIVYLEYDGEFRHTFCDDMQLQISTISRQEDESPSDYFERKLLAFRRICGGKRVLFVLDNYTDRLTKDLSRIINCGFETMIATRNQPPKNSFAHMEVTALRDNTDLLKLAALNLGHPLSREERACFEEMIGLIQGHTLVLELIARQIAAGRLDVRAALELIRENGFSRFSDEKIGNIKDGEEVCDTLSAIISALFDAGTVSMTERLALKRLALLNVRGIEAELIGRFFSDIQPKTAEKLAANGWLYDGGRVRLHPVIAETVRGWEWQADDLAVMEYHQQAVDIYVGMGNAAQIKAILREAERFAERHPRHIIAAMYHNMVGFYYDALLGGAYYTETAEEEALLEKLIASADAAIAEAELSQDERKGKYLAQYCISLASVLIRSMPDCENEAAELLDRARGLIESEPAASENRCYYCMAAAWYFTLIRPDLDETRRLIGRAEQIAKQVFSTELELIDIINIPAANCCFYHGELDSAAKKIEEAAEMCGGHPDSLPYIDKKAELLNILIDIYLEMGDLERCRGLAAEIDRMNEEYGEMGLRREISPDKREKIGI